MLTTISILYIARACEENSGSIIRSASLLAAQTRSGSASPSVVTSEFFGSLSQFVMALIRDYLQSQERDLRSGRRASRQYGVRALFYSGKKDFMCVLDSNPE